MKKLILFLFLLISTTSYAQTTIYARSSGPAGFIPVGVTNGTPPTVTTDRPSGLATGDKVVISGICSGVAYTAASGRSPYNGVFIVASTPTAYTFTINDLAGVAVVGNGNSVSCKSLPGSSTSASFGGKVNSFTLGTGPYGFLDGLTGTNTRKLALTTANGLTSIIVTSGVAAVITSYPHGIVTGDQISITGSLNSNLNTHNGVGAYAPHTVAASPAPTATTFSFDAPGVPNGTYAGVNNACGPAATPNDTIGGTEDCLVLSQLAFIGNTFWDRVLSDNAFTNTVANYTFAVDGGNFWPAEASVIYPLQYGQVAVQFYVDRSNAALMAVGAYIMPNFQHISGVNWLCDTDYGHCALANFEGDADEAYIGASEMAMIWLPYLSPTHRQKFIDIIYNDIGAFGVTPADISKQDAGTDKLNRLVNIGGSNPATGVVVAGDATHVTLAAGDTAATNAYVGNMIGFTYVTAIASITTGTTTTITTAGNYYGALTPYQITLSGITGTGCSSLNHFWQTGNGFSPVSANSFVVNLDTTGCISPTGGTSTSFPVCQTGDRGPCLGTITAYDSTTKVATVAAGGFRSAKGLQDFSGTVIPTSDMTYRIYQTITASTIAQNTKGVTITGKNTKFLTDFAPGDALMGLNWFADSGGKPHLSECYLSPTTTITSDTVMTADCAFPSNWSDLHTTTPTLLWVVKGWTTGQGGMNWLSAAWEGSPVGRAVINPLNGGTGSTNAGHMAEGANNGILEVNGHVGLGAVVAPYDNRAVLDLAYFETYGFDYILRHYLNYNSGNAHSGSQYSGGVLYGVGQMIVTLRSNIPGFPAIDTTGFKNTPMWHLYSILPALHDSGLGKHGFPMGFAGNSGDAELNPGANTQAYLFDPAFYFHPTDDRTKYFKYFLQNTTSINLWTGAEASANYKTTQALILDDPRVAAVNFNSQPLQYAMIKSAANGATNACATLTGWTCSPAYSSAAFFSKSLATTGSFPTSWGDRGGTLTYFGARVWDDDHDQPQNGVTWIYKAGPLLGCDAAAGFLQEGVHDNTLLCDMFRVGIPNFGSTLQPGLLNNWKAGNPQDGITPLTQWASGNHGTWDYQYGDQSSKFAYGCSDLANAYIVGTLLYGTRCVADMKNQALNGGTGEQIVFQFNEAVPPSPTPVSFGIHYMQVGQGQYTGGNGVQYPEGSTTCPGTGSCPSIDTNRTILSVEDNATDALNPQRKYGLVTKVLSPGTITMKDDNPAVTVSSVVKTTAASISALTTGVTTTVQTSSAHNAVVGEPVVVSGVSGTIASGTIATLTPGATTDIVTSGSYSLLTTGQIATIAGVTGTGSCNGRGVVTAISGTHFTVDRDTSTCVGPSGGTITADGACNGSGVVLARPDSTHYTVQYNSVPCTSPTSGTSTTPTLFNATAHGLYTTAAISSISLANPVVVTTATAHGLVVGQYVDIFGVTSTGGSCNGINSLGYTDAYIVTSVPSSTTFTVGFNSTACLSPTGGRTYTDYAHTITIVGATGDWNALNTYYDSHRIPTQGNNTVPQAVWPIDANTFSLVGAPDTSAYTGSFDGAVAGVYLNGLGWSHRFSICGGSQCGAATAGLTALVAHKVMQSVTDTSLTATAITPDANWFGAQTTDKVVLFGRGGVLHTPPTDFTTTHAGTAQYLLAGFKPGVYGVTIGGLAVSGSPFTLTSAFDPTISFESTAGAVHVSGTPTTCAITTTSLAGATVNAAYSQTLASTGCTGAVTWQVVGGALCSPLVLNAAPGAITGTPWQDGACTLTFSATDSATSPITVFSAPMTITVTSTCTITTTGLPGVALGAAYSQALSTGSCSPPITWSVVSGTLCAGLSLGSSTGQITGTPTAGGMCSFTVQAVDSTPTTSSQALSITVTGQTSRAPVIGGKFGGGGRIVIH